MRNLSKLVFISLALLGGPGLVYGLSAYTRGMLLTFPISVPANLLLRPLVAKFWSSRETPISCRLEMKSALITKYCKGCLAAWAWLWISIV